MATDCRLNAELRVAALDAVLPHMADVLFHPPSCEGEWLAQAMLSRLDAALAPHPLIHPAHLGRH